MEGNHRFNRITHVDEIAHLKSQWLSTLTSPQDGMWESFRNSAMNWGILFNDELVGYASVDEGNQLLQFYISPNKPLRGEVIFKEFIGRLKITTGIVGTNNLGYLSIALSFVNKLHINTYLFRSNHEVSLPEKEGTFWESQDKDNDRLVAFYHKSMGAPKEWLVEYIGGLIERREIFSLQDGDTLIGTCEVRKSATSPEFADIGMVVSPDFRRRGYGTYLLNRAKTIAIAWGKTPICSCEKDNLGSLKSIANCGFTSMYQLLSISFK